jgi:quercetin dioxygenase-like cupin family protein
MIILKGKCELFINLESYIITEESIVTIMPNSIIQMNNYSEEFDAYICYGTWIYE